MTERQPARQAVSHQMPATGQIGCPDCVRGLRRIAYFGLGGVFFVLGMVGIVLPGLPTTPFLLLTSYFLARSSPRLQRRLLSSRLLGPILSHWQRHRAVEPRMKRRAVALVGVAMALLVAFSPMPPALLAIVLVLALVGLLVICRLPTVARETTPTQLPEEQV